MLHNDISNYRSFVIGVRCENTLFTKKKGILPKVNSLITNNPFKSMELNLDVLNFANHIYWNTEMTLALVIDDNNYTREAEDFLLNLPFNHIYNIRNLSEVTMMLNTGNLSYFLDNDKIELQNVNSEYAMDLQKFNTVIRRKGMVHRL